MYNPDDSDDDTFDDSDGIPRLPPVPAIHAEPTDKTIRGFTLSMNTAAVVLAPVTASDAVTAAMPNGGVADGSIDRATAPLAPAVPIAADDAPTAVVTPLDVGYRYAVLRQVAALACDGSRRRPGLRRVNAMPAVSVRVDPSDHTKVVVTVRRWRDFAAWVRVEALDNFVSLKSTLAAWPDEVKTGARSVLRQLTEACHQPGQASADGFVYLWL